MRSVSCLLTCLLLCAPAMAQQFRPSAHGPAFTPPPPKPVIERVGIDQHLGADLPLDAHLRDEEGQDVALGDYFHSRPVVLCLVYYSCPMLCTMELNDLTGSLKMLSLDAGQDFDVVAVSFDPTETSALAAEKKAAYVRSYQRPGAEPGWHFLTGDEPAIRRLTDAVGFRYYKDPHTGQYAHASAVFVVTPAGRLSRYFYGIDYSPRDLRLALVESSQGKVGSLADAITLLCYQYDPAKARYGLAIMTVLRAGGLLTLASITTFAVVSIRRERRRGTPDTAGGASP